MLILVPRIYDCYIIWKRGIKVAEMIVSNQLTLGFSEWAQCYHKHL